MHLAFGFVWKVLEFSQKNWKSSDEFNALLSRPVFNKLQKKLLVQMKYDMKMKEKFISEPLYYTNICHKYTFSFALPSDLK